MKKTNRELIEEFIKYAKDEYGIDIKVTKEVNPNSEESAFELLFGKLTPMEEQSRLINQYCSLWMDNWKNYYLGSVGRYIQNKNTKNIPYRGF